MTLLLLLLILAVPAPKPPETGERMVARVTVYYKGEDKWGDRTSTGERAKPYKTAAVDPKVIPYGSTIYIPELKLTLRANDTGSAVKKRTAAKKMGKNCPVVDVYVGTRREGRKCIRNWPAFAKIIIND